MHSIAIASLLAAAATLTGAAPTPANSDPTVCAPGTGFFQVCASNGFRGCCKTDACSSSTSWCPDYKPFTYEPAAHWSRSDDPTVCKPGTGFFQVCANGFRGCCKTDACSSSTSWCPDYKPKTYEPAHWARAEDPTVCRAGTGYYQVCANGFKGCCKTDACSSSWCPDYKHGTHEAASAPAAPPAHEVPNHNMKPATDPTVCAPGTGFFQACANGFRGCCKTDACSSNTAWCPDYKFGTYEPAAAPHHWSRSDDPTVCPAGTGYYQVCASGFKGCCKTDACTTGYCA